MKLSYAVVVEQYPNNYGAYAPDVPGCISTAATPDEMLANIREALAFHIEGLVEGGDPVPVPTMSIDDAIAHHSGPVPEDALSSYSEFGAAAEALSTRFETVEVEISTPQATLAS